MKKFISAMKKENNKGITLVALVVTIVVLLILAGVTINLVIGQNGLINRAKDAAKKTTLAGLIDEVQTEIAAAQIQSAGAEVAPASLKTILDQYFDNVPESYMLKDDTSLKSKSEYGNYEIKISELYSGTMNENDTTDCTVYTDENGKKAPVPTGFTVSTVEGENLVDKGLVIKENSTGNEYVWIPCAIDGSDKLQYQRTRWGVEPDNGTDAWKDELTLTDSSVQYTSSDIGMSKEVSKEIVNQINSEFASVKKYGGYYIGRYETGVGDNYKAVVQANKEPYAGTVNTNPTRWTEAYNLAKGIGAGNGATTYLCSSYAWDTAVNFIMNNGTKNYATARENFNENWKDKQVVDSTGKEIKAKDTAQRLTTGQTTAKSNIFDMGGNVTEFTTEINPGTGEPVVLRGGYYNFDNGPAGNRFDSNAGRSNSNYGFRATLFLK